MEEPAPGFSPDVEGVLLPEFCLEFWMDGFPRVYWWDKKKVKMEKSFFEELEESIRTLKIPRKVPKSARKRKVLRRKNGKIGFQKGGMANKGKIVNCKEEFSVANLAFRGQKIR